MLPKRFVPIQIRGKKWAVLERTRSDNRSEHAAKQPRAAISEAFEPGPSDDDHRHQKMTQFLSADSTQTFLCWLATQPPATQHRILLELLSALSRQLSDLQTP